MTYRAISLVGHVTIIIRVPFQSKAHRAIIRYYLSELCLVVISFCFIILLVFLCVYTTTVRFPEKINSDIILGMETGSVGALVLGGLLCSYLHWSAVFYVLGGGE